MTDKELLNEAYERADRRGKKSILDYALGTAMDHPQLRLVIGGSVSNSGFALCVPHNITTPALVGPSV